MLDDTRLAVPALAEPVDGLQELVRMAVRGAIETAVEVELTRALGRATSSDYAGVDRRIRPYSAAILPDMDRIVVTTTDMDNRDTTRAVQLWRLSDLSVQHTIELPNGTRGDEGYRSAEPRGSRRFHERRGPAAPCRWWPGNTT